MQIQQKNYSYFSSIDFQLQMQLSQAVISWFYKSRDHSGIATMISTLTVGLIISSQLNKSNNKSSLSWLHAGRNSVCPKYKYGTYLGQRMCLRQNCGGLKPCCLVVCFRHLLPEHCDVRKPDLVSSNVGTDTTWNSISLDIFFLAILWIQCWK